MVRIFAVLFLFSVLLPGGAAVAADEFDYLMGDVEKFEEDIGMNAEAESAAKQEHLYQSSDELFPDTEKERGGRLGDGALQQFVTIRVDGVPTNLTDVPSDAWFAPYVRGTADRGIISGYRGADGLPLGLFGPGDNVTIEQLAKMAIEATGHILQDCSGGELRNESARGSWSEQYIRCVEYLQWAVYSDGAVDVKRPATRSEVVVTILQAFGVLFDRALGTVFSDVTASTEFSGAIERAAADNIVSGYADGQGNLTGEFGPGDPVNRAEAAKILSLALQVYGGEK